MTRPTRAVLLRLAEVLDARLRGDYVDRLWRVGERQVLVQFRRLKPARLLIDVELGHPRVVVTTRWPDTPKAPDRVALILRRLLEGARVIAIDARHERWLELKLARGDGERLVTIQLAGRYPNLAAWGAEPGEGPPLVQLIDGTPAVDPESPPLRPSQDAEASLLSERDDAAFLETMAAESWRARDERHFADRVTSLRRAARGLWNKARRAVAALERDLAKADASQNDRRYGELLKTVLGKIPAGARSVSVTDWADPDGGTVTVPLDPSLSAVDNMSRYFKRYRRYARSRALVAERLVAATTRLAAVESVVEALEGRVFQPEIPLHTQLDALGSTDRALTRLGLRAKQAPPRKSARSQAKKRPYQRFLARDGSEILVGRDARGNDELTLKIARGNDVFMHARDVPGSHVILRRAAARSEPSQQAMQDAAMLAAWHSRARGEAVVDVLWTERKHVRKARGGKAGQVTTASARTITVRADPERIAALYETLDSDR